MAKAKANSLDFGFSSPIPQNSDSWTEDRVEREIVKNLQTERRVMLLNAARGVPQQQATSRLDPPPASTLSESTKAMIDLTKETTEIQKGVTESYKDLAHIRKEERDDAEKRSQKIRDEAEEKATQAAAAKEKEALTMAEWVDKAHEREIAALNSKHELETSINERLSAMESKLGTAQLEAVKAEFKAELDSLRKSFEFQQQTDKAKIAELEQKNQSLSTRETVADMLNEYFETGKVPSKLAALLHIIGGGTDPSADPNIRLQNGWVDKYLDSMDQENQDHADERDHKKTMREKQGNLLDNLAGLVLDGRAMVQNLARAGNLPGRRGVPPITSHPSPPPPPAMEEPLMEEGDEFGPEGED